MEKTKGWLVALLCTLGIAVSVLTYGPALRYSARGINDFRAIYPGARLAGSSKLYDPQEVLAIEIETTGRPARELPYSRLPYFALLISPLGHLPYMAAYWIWQALCLAGAIAFALLWEVPGRKAVVLATCASVPLFGALAIGQDVPLLLATIAVSAYLGRRNRWFLAGAVLALCAAKIHLFLLIPVFIVGRRMWRFGAGLLAGGGVLFALSFIGGGAHWVQSYLTYLTRPMANPNADEMPNLHGIVGDLSGSMRTELLLAAIVALLVWFAARRGSFEYAFAATLAGCLLVSHHAYMADCALLMPGLLMIAAKADDKWLRGFAVFLLTPICYVFMLMGSAIWITRAAIVLFLIGLAWAARRHEADAKKVIAAA